MMVIAGWLAPKYTFEYWPNGDFKWDDIQLTCSLPFNVYDFFRNCLILGSQWSIRFLSSGNSSFPHGSQQQPQLKIDRHPVSPFNLSWSLVTVKLSTLPLPFPVHQQQILFSRSLALEPKRIVSVRNVYRNGLMAQLARDNMPRLKCNTQLLPEDKSLFNLMSRKIQVGRRHTKKVVMITRMTLNIRNCLVLRQLLALDWLTLRRGFAMVVASVATGWCCWFLLSWVEAVISFDWAGWLVEDIFDVVLVPVDVEPGN